MRQLSNEMPLRRMTQAVTMAVASLVATGAHAQSAAPGSTAPEIQGPTTTVQVVGARQSQQSAIARKRNADTAQDSIIAEDVGAFPDRNVADAISRVAGVALDRGDYGEGVSVSIRGNGPELTRVELDGQGVQQAGGTDMLGGINAGQDAAGGRGVEMRQLSSDLIKSVDIVKGSTADMTEGSLGGGVRITTRNGLDFKKDYLSVRVSGTENSINKKVNPDLNLVGVKKFMDDKLGVLVNLSKSKRELESHKIQQGGTSNQVGAIRPLDFDKSPEKTFSFQPSTVKLDDPLATTPLQVSNLAAGGTFNSATPQQIVERSAAAQSKDDCYAAFPLFTFDQENTFTTGTNRTNAINARQNELASCLGQWNDWINSNGRYNVSRYKADRNSGDIRFDYKVSDNLTVYVKHSRSNDTVRETSSDLTFGGYNPNPAAVNGPNGYAGLGTIETPIPANPNLPNNGRAPNGASWVRSVAPGSGYFYYPDLSFRGGTPTNGTVTNVDPASVVTDANHHVTKYALADGSYGIDNTTRYMETRSRYTQAGANYKNRWVRAELLLGDSSSTFSRYEKRASFSAYTGPTDVAVLPNGIWNYTPRSMVDITNPENFYRLRPQGGLNAVTASATTPASPAYTAGQTPNIDPARNLPLQNARINESFERTLKLDLAFNTGDFTNGYVPQIKTGYNRRKSGYDAWGTGGYTAQNEVGEFGKPGYVPGVYVPGSNLRTTYQVCQDTPGSLAPGGKPCVYGYTPSPNPSTSLQGTIQVTPEQFRDLFKGSLTVPPTGQFYGGDKDRPAGLTNGWTEIDIDKLYAQLQVPNYNLNCIKSCAGSDGKTYAQPKNAIAETVDAGYLMADFALDHVPFSERALPFGVEFDGNVGVRAVKTKVFGTGQLQFTSITKNRNFNPVDPGNAAGVDTRIYRKDVTLNAQSTDYLPSVNLNMWLLDRKVVARYNWGKTVARPAAGRLVPTGSCTYDQRFEDVADSSDEPQAQRCSGTIGNPELKPLTNHNQNLSLEWYPNKDNMLSFSYYKQEGKIGAATLIEGISGANLFAGSGEVDSASGKSLADLAFNYNRWTNQLPSNRTGIEVGGKTAFTFLPWYLRYTGLDANYTRNKSNLTGTAVRDLLTGTIMPVAGEPHHSWNASLWYDDGVWSARVALQVVADKFNCISGCNLSTGINNYPAQGLTVVRAPGYAPGAPSFRLSTRYVDAKLGYKFSKNIELFVEGRNLGKTHTGNTTGGYADFADGTPNVYTDNYTGATYMAGVNFRFGGE
jgi:TonB-dependent receptor